MRILGKLFERKVNASKARLTQGQPDIWMCPITTMQTPMKQCIDDTLTQRRSQAGLVDCLLGRRVRGRI